MSKRTDNTGSRNPLGASFVPGILKKQFSKNPKWHPGDETTDKYTALLWLDICDFSTLCNRLMNDKVKGVEAITSILHEHYGFLLERITKWGGEPLFFAGDGIMAAWPGNKSEAEKSVAHSMECAREILQQNQVKDDRGRSISLHLVMAYGPWHMAEIEAPGDKKLFTFYGEVFDNLRLASRNTAKDILLAHESAMEHVPQGVPSQKVEFESTTLEDLNFELPEYTVPQRVEPVFNPPTLKELRAFIPPTIPEPLSAERLQWLSEIRPVTSLFLSFPLVDDKKKSFRDEIDRIGRVAKPLVEKYDGLLNMFWVDEKATNMLICFGPSPSAHNNNPERSARLAFELNRNLEGEGFSNSIGISTGSAYCGVIGTDVFRQHTVIGDVVNLSSRYSQVSTGAVVCDEATYLESRKSVEFGEPFTTEVKGYSGTVQLFPIKDIREEETATPIGIWEKELQQILRLIGENGRKDTLVFIEGQSGMGKTSLLHELRANISTNDHVILTSGDKISRNIPYSIWDDVFSSILEMHLTDGEGLQGDSTAELEGAFGERACLLNIVLNTNIEDSSLVKEFTPTQRVKATHDLLMEILKKEGESHKLVILIDNAQWIDEISWKFIESINETPINCKIVLSLQKAREQKYIHLENLKRFELIELNELSESGVEELICNRFNTKKATEELVILVHRIAKGNPFFSMEFLDSLRIKELLDFENDTCSLKPDVVLSELSLPETVKGAVRSRIDRLDQGSQLSLKVGSVIGQRFAKGIVTEIYPIREERMAVTSYLEEAQHFGLLSDAIVDDYEGYLFNNETIAEVAYDMILAEQRRHLHKESAEWYEKNFKDYLQPFYLRLMYHWNAAGKVGKAIHYCRLESMRLFQQGFVQQALEVGLQGAELLDYEVPREADVIGARIGDHMAQIGALMNGRSIEGLKDLKPLENEETEVLIDLFLYLCPLAHQCHQAELFAMLPVICLQRTLEEGSGPSAAEVYSMYSIIHKALTGDHHGAFQWSNLALEIDAKNNNTRQARVSFIHCWFIAHWFVPFRELIPMADRGADAGFRLNDILYACFNLSLSLVLKCVSGHSLQEVVAAAEANLLRNNKLVRNARFHLIHEKQVALAFQGKTEDYLSLSDSEVDEATDLASILDTDMYNQVAYYQISKLKLNTHYHQWKEAINWAESAAPLLQAFANQPGHVEFEQYYTIAALYLSQEGDLPQGEQLSALADTKIEMIETWATQCEVNFLHKYLLVKAIHTGLTGEIEVADKLFEQAATQALKSGFLQDAGLAYEHKAVISHRNNRDHKGAIDKAIGCYHKWGAGAKVTFLTDTYL